MNQPTFCPVCKLAVSSDPAGPGNPGVCPGCNTLITAGKPRAAGPDLASAFREAGPLFSKERLSRLEMLDALRVEAEALAEQYHIDLNESFPVETANRMAALERFEEARQALPEVPPYRTANALPPGGLRSMMLAAFVAIPAALVMELLTCCLVVGIIAVAALLLEDYSRRTVLLGLFALATLILPSKAGGWASARVLTAIGRRHKIRHRWLAAILAAPVAGSTILILWAAYRQWGAEPLQEWDPLRLGAKFDLLANLAFGANFLWALVSGARQARGMLSEERFCEKCQEFMTRARIWSLRAGVIRAVVIALARGSIPLAAYLLEREPGEDGAAGLSRCPKCGSGFLEIRATMITVNKRWHFYHAIWDVTLMDLTSEQVEWFDEHRSPLR